MRCLVLSDTQIGSGRQLADDRLADQEQVLDQIADLAHERRRRLREHADEVLLFVSDLSVPFTNNLGERAIRMPKVKQKISGCFRTLKGAENFAIIRSYLDTLHKQGRNLIEALRLAFQGSPPQPATG